MDWSVAAYLAEKEYEEKFPHCHEYIKFSRWSVTLDGDFTSEKLDFISMMLKKYDISKDSKNT